MEQIEFEMSCVIFCDCMAGAAFAFPHIFLTSVCVSLFSLSLSISFPLKQSHTLYLLNNWLFNSQGKVLCSESQFFFKAANHVNIAAETFLELSIESLKPEL